MSSCQLYKNYERPSDIITDGIYGDMQTAGDNSLGDLGWRDIFTDPKLQTLIERGLSQNSDMKNAELRIKEADYALQCAKLAYIPSLYFNPSGNISKAWDPYDRNDYAASKTYSLPVQMSWQIGSIGSLRNNKKKAEVTRDQLRNAKQAIQAQIVASIASMYYNLSMLDEQRLLTKQTEENWGKYLHMQKQLMDAGQSNMAAVASIEATYYSIQTSVISIDNSIYAVENALSTLIGETQTHIDRSSLASFQAPAVCSTGLPITILDRRPDVRDAEYKLAAAFYDKNIAYSSFFPQLNISASGQFTNSLGAVVNPGVFIGAAVASLAQPLFDNGRIRAKYKVSKAEMEIATNDFKQAVIKAGNEVNLAMDDIYVSRLMQELIDKQVTSLSKALDATQKLYQNTGTNYLNVITAQNSLLTAQMSQISNRMDAIKATIDLYQALGGGAE
ncbi:MAG: TolC family protein [Bacteroidaceae bacterium]|nr:TolC family protein [Bacteroidaceae bacterium]MBQ9169217.1 TolC family protein [Bacteroidaceae bacterium]MBQ9293339.1 TolC family protein [Bacteroidaceae bacterium]